MRVYSQPRADVGDESDVSNVRDERNVRNVAGVSNDGHERNGQPSEATDARRESLETVAGGVVECRREFLF
jgi:hypothetical protein